MKIGTNIACALMIVLSGCGTTPKKQQGYNDEYQTILQFCSSFADRITGKEAGVVVSAFDHNNFVKNVVSGTQLSLQEKSTFTAGFEPLMNKVLGTFENSLFAFGGWYVQSFKDNGARGKCVLQSGIVDSGVSIIEFYITNNKSIKISNWFDHTQGVLATDRLRLTLSDLYRLGNSAAQSEEKKREYMSLVGFAQAIQTRDIDKAFEYYYLLPYEMTKSGMNALNLVSLSTLVGKRYDEATEILLDIPDYTSRPFIIIDYLLKKKEYEQIHLILDKLEDDIGESTVVEIMRSSLYSQQGQPKKSWKHALKSIDIDNSYEASYWHVFSQFVEQESYSDAVLVLDVLYKAWGYDFTRATFADKALYKNLASTPVFDAWIKSL